MTQEKLEPLDSKELLTLMQENDNLANSPEYAKAVNDFYRLKIVDKICSRFGTKKSEIDAEKVAKLITKYFILEKRFLRNKFRRILFGEDDSVRLGKLIAISDIWKEVK